MPLPFVQNFSSLAPSYDVVFADVWGVVHNGVAATVSACNALKRFRQGGGTVVLMSNAPRPSKVVARASLDALGVPADCYDTLITSGDVTRSMLAIQPGAKVWHLGPDRDVSIFEGLDVSRVSLEDASLVVCSGPFDDENETVAEYQPTFEAMLTRRLPMICANPDLVVERGDKLVICAGLLADTYRDLGGPVTYAGKPYRPVYEAALQAATTRRGAPVDLSRILAIGDALRTDLTGARDFGIDALFVTSGIHAHELGPRDNPNPTQIATVLAATDLSPVAVTPVLAW